MINIVIAAGYATRLYPLTINTPKPLLEIGDNTILGRLMDDIDAIPEISRHIIVVNHKFLENFKLWLMWNHFTKPVILVDDNSYTNESRLGAVKDLLLAIEKEDVNDDILVVAADNILDFSIAGFVEAFKRYGSSMIMCHKEPSIKALQRTGVIEVDSDMKVLQMQEKPQTPVSHWAVPPFYIYKKDDLPLIRNSLKDGCGVDAPGNLAHYLVDRTTIHAWEMPGRRYDIGTLDTYESVKEKFSKAFE